MSAILKAVIKKEGDMREGTDSYVDDILVDETALPASNLVSHKAAGIIRRNSIGSSARQGKGRQSGTYKKE